MRRTVLVLAATSAAACVGPPPPEVHPGVPAPLDSSAPALPPPERAAFVVRRGGDTVFVERFSRTRDLLSGDIEVRGQGTIEYQASLDATHAVSRLVAGIVPAGNPAAAAAQRTTAEFRGDTVVVQTVAGDSTRTARYSSQAGAVAYVNPSMALAEQIVLRARAIGGTQVAVPVFVAGTGGQTVTGSVTFARPDSVQVTIAGTTFNLTLDRNGRLARGTVPAQGLTVERKPGT